MHSEHYFNLGKPTVEVRSEPPDQDLLHRAYMEMQEPNRCPLKQGQPLESATRDLISRLGLTPDSMLLTDLNRTSIAGKAQSLSHQDQELLKVMTNNQFDLQALSRGAHVATGRGYSTWGTWVGADGITAGDMAKFDQLQNNYDAAVRSNPELAKANSIFEFATTHFSELSDKSGHITFESLQAAAKFGNVNADDLRMIALMEKEMPSLKRSEMSDAGRFLEGVLPSVFNPDSGVLAVPGLSIAGLQAHTLDAYQKATKAGMTESYQAQTVLNVRAEEAACGR